MILDAKEQWYTLENLEKVEHMQFLPIDAYAIENGKRCLEIPEGVKSISEDAAAVYNIGSIVSNISYILSRNAGLLMKRLAFNQFMEPQS
jgi:hypothetical protein